ncbi:MAG: hypothetical protein ACOCTL_02350 [Candidatus Hadarchaeota archaeon]
MTLKNCPVCGEEFQPVWENKKIKCEKCKSAMKIEDFHEIERKKLECLDKKSLTEFFNHLTSKIHAVTEERKKLKNRADALGAIVEQSG